MLQSLLLRLRPSSGSDRSADAATAAPSQLFKPGPTLGTGSQDGHLNSSCIGDFKSWLEFIFKQGFSLLRAFTEESGSGSRVYVGRSKSLLLQS